jgi:hypothetical protein
MPQFDVQVALLNVLWDLVRKLQNFTGRPSFMVAESLVMMVNEQTPDRMITLLSFWQHNIFGVLDTESTLGAKQMADQSRGSRFWSETLASAW